MSYNLRFFTQSIQVDYENTALRAASYFCFNLHSLINNQLTLLPAKWLNDNALASFSLLKAIDYPGVLPLSNKAKMMATQQSEQPEFNPTFGA